MQLKKLRIFIERRKEIANKYDVAFENIPEITPLKVSSDVFHAYHLYVVKINFNALRFNRNILFKLLREKGIGVNVHYIPVHFHPFYRSQFGTDNGLCPISEQAYENIISLPIFYDITEEELKRVINAMQEAILHNK